MTHPPVKRLEREASCKCPECGYLFKGNGFDGIDAHWRSKHNAIMAYEQAWPLIRAGSYVKVAQHISNPSSDDGH